MTPILAAISRYRHLTLFVTAGLVAMFFGKDAFIYGRTWFVGEHDWSHTVTKRPADPKMPHFIDGHAGEEILASASDVRLNAYIPCHTVEGKHARARARRQTYTHTQDTPRAHAQTYVRRKYAARVHVHLQKHTQQHTKKHSRTLLPKNSCTNAHAHTNLQDFHSPNWACLSLLGPG